MDLFRKDTLTKGKYHKLGQHYLKTNNVLVLDFDKYGILKEKKLFDKMTFQKFHLVKNKQKMN